jgi:hypothetical protein
VNKKKFCELYLPIQPVGRLKAVFYLSNFSTVSKNNYIWGLHSFSITTPAQKLDSCYQQVLILQLRKDRWLNRRYNTNPHRPLWSGAKDVHVYHLQLVISTGCRIIINRVMWSCSRALHDCNKQLIMSTGFSTNSNRDL